MILNMKNYKKGSALIVFLVIIAVAAIGGGIYYFVNKSKTESTNTVVTQQTSNTNTTEQASTTVQSTNNKPTTNTGVKKPQATSSSVTNGAVTVATFQTVINSYSACGANDIECMCKYLTSFHCGKLKEGGTATFNKLYPAFPYIVKSTVLKQLSVVNNYKQPWVNNGQETEARSYLARAVKSFNDQGQTYQCVSISFIKEGVQWRIGLPNAASCDA
jgi:uncharacterized protein YxeA